MNTEGEKQFALIMKHIKTIDMLLDFGPGTMYSEAWSFREKFPNCIIVGIEACGDRYNKIKKDYPGTLLKMAVDSYSGKGEGWEGGKFGQFIFSKERSMTERWNDNLQQVGIEVITADDIWDRYKTKATKNVFIWADVEGAELRMLQGAGRLFQSGTVVGCNLETYPKNPQKIWPYYNGIRCTADQVVPYMERLGYKNIGSSEHPELLTKYGKDYESKKWLTDCLFVKGKA